jgi:hypothetical protein
MTKNISYTMRRKILWSSIFLVFAFSCNRDGRKSFFLNVNHYGGATGTAVMYTIDERNLLVETNCDLADCKQKTVYKRTFTRNESDSIYGFVFSLRLDTLKLSYQTPGISDGLYTMVTISDGSFSGRTITFDNYTLQSTENLFMYIDSLILTKKYRFYDWGESE